MTVFFVWLLLLPYTRKFYKNKSYKRDIERLTEEINEIKKLYNEACKLWNNLSSKPEQRTASVTHSEVIMDFANQVTTGEMELEIRRIINILEGLDSSQINQKDLLNIKNCLAAKKEIVSRWQNVLAQYDRVDT